MLSREELDRIAAADEARLGVTAGSSYSATMRSWLYVMLPESCQCVRK
jgi:hypothetical protein